MGPVLSFDKSFLESLTQDEAMWLDNFFLTNITPTFYVETLADLNKGKKKGRVERTEEELVEEICKKTPSIESCPNVHYKRLVVEELMGHQVEMDEHHRPIISGGEYHTLPDGNVGINFRQFPETAALGRWKRHQFLEVERDFASVWRQSLTNLNFDDLIIQAKNNLPNDIHFSSMLDVKKYVDESVKSRYNQYIHFALLMLDIPDKARKQILERWHQTRPMSFEQFAPYAAYVLKINLFFYLCLNKSFLSESHKGKPSNIVDLSYLYYLPFCMIFTSNDSLHVRIASMFMGKEQTFVLGKDLKADLKRLNDFYLKLPDEIKEQGVMKFAQNPPTEIDTLTGELYDKYMKPWRKNAKDKLEKPDRDPARDKELLEYFKKIEKEQKPYTGPPISSDQAHSVTLSRMVPLKRGNWWILPKDFEKNKETNVK
jgi:hypothetical protein